MTDGEKPYRFDDAARARWVAEMVRIEAAQAGCPTCALCGQRTMRLDRYGLCPKVSAPHRGWRAEARAEERKAN